MPKRHVEKSYTYAEGQREREQDWLKLALMLLEEPGAGAHRRCDFGQFGPPSENSHKAQAAVEDFVDELVDIANGTGFNTGLSLDLETRQRAAMAVCRILQTNALHLSPQVDSPCPTCGASDERCEVELGCVDPCHVPNRLIDEAAEPDEYDVALLRVGPNKRNVIKALSELRGISCEEAHFHIECTPAAITTGARQDVEAIKRQFEALGATVEIRS